MSDRIWNAGPPPHAGWWNASVALKPRLSNASVALEPRLSNAGDPTCWRWWNGTHWSWAAWPTYDADCAANEAGGLLGASSPEIFWTDFWPENARVPRIDPRVEVELDDAPRQSTEEERELAREQYAVGSDDDIEIDDDARASVDPETENIWVQAWLYVRKT